MLLWGSLLTTCPLRAQIPHGSGSPLAEGSESLSGLRTCVDYFVEMPILDTDSARYVDDLPGNRVGGLRFAHTFYTHLSPENSGMLFTTSDGTRVWKLGIRSNGAFSINVLFSTFVLPEGGKVFLYNSDRSVVLGPFTRENQTEAGSFSVAPVDGDELTVEYQEPADAAFPGKLCITEVNHDYRGLFLRMSHRYNTLNMPCLPDVSCDTSLNAAKRSVCLLIINGNTYCTGTFVNNTALDGKPYLLTAAHCLKGNPDLGSRIVAFLNYESPGCDPRVRGSEEFSLSGSVCRAMHSGIDYSLIEFMEKPPMDYRLYLAGWRRDSLSFDRAPFTCIHHPNGDTKKYCIETDTLEKSSPPPYFDLEPNNHWHVWAWEKGHTWGGSSGAPLFDRSMHLVGALSGGGSGGDYGCGTDTVGDYFYRLDRSWQPPVSTNNQLMHWLDPITPDGQTSSTVTLDGMEAYVLRPAKRIGNVALNDSLNSLDYRNGWGTLFGHNSMGIRSFAEHFFVRDSSMVLGAYLMVRKGHFNADRPVYVRIYEGGGRTPGKILAKQLLHPSYQNYDYLNNTFYTTSKTIFSNKENYVRFSSPVSVGTDFFIGYEITYPVVSEQDTFDLYGVVGRRAGNSAYFKLNNRWYPYYEFPNQAINSALWVESVVAADTVTVPNTYSETDSDTLVNILRPIAVWENVSRSLQIYFPSTWSGETQAELFDAVGKNILNATVYPSVATLSLGSAVPRLLILRLSNRNQVVTLKIPAGI
jgi:hypothetical protein